jgi:alkylation response protein AidB-like acyl-CoA dehydrogenase
MLVAVERAVGTAWDAANAADSDDADRQLPLAAAIASTTAIGAAATCAKDCVQLLGGIGFTWEHDAHVFLKRALAVRQLLTPAHATATRLALAGARRTRTVDLGPEADAIRADIARAADELKQLEREERRRKMADDGWLVPHWPTPWGRDAGPLEQLVIDEEFARAQVARPNLAVGAWAAPTIVAHGTPEQQERWVGPTLRGEIAWCQLFSEPGAGSDLASLTTKATRTDGGWLLSGQKVWTSLARDADWGICLARTNPNAPKHLGITYFVVDMRAEGIDIRPLRELTGMAMFNEVFLSDVFVPDEAVIGDVDGGWTLARTTLANERVAMASGSSFGGGVEALLTLVGARDDLRDDDVVLDLVGELLAEASSISVLSLRTTLRALTGAKPGPEASVRKLFSAEHDQRVQELGLVLLGPDGAVAEGDGATWSYGFLANRCLTIAGGTSEVQRNVIAERILGLPRDP